MEIEFSGNISLTDFALPFRATYDKQQTNLSYLSIPIPNSTQNAHSASALLTAG
jgi:hypothetical protein